jgi:hypothetical protein
MTSRRIVIWVTCLVVAASSSVAGSTKKPADSAAGGCMDLLLKADRLPRGIVGGWSGLPKSDALRLADRHGFNIAYPDPSSDPRASQALKDCMSQSTGSYPKTKSFRLCLEKKGRPDLALLFLPTSVSTATNAAPDEESANRHLILLRIAERKLAREVVECTS